MFRLYVLTDAEVLPCAVLGPRPLEIGRGPTNDIVLTDSRVSWHHASIWADSDGVSVRDSSSRHGTAVDGRRVHGVARVADGAVIRIGERVRLLLRKGLEAFSTPEPPRWRIDDVATGLATVIRGVVTALPGNALAWLDSVGRVQIDGQRVAAGRMSTGGRERDVVEIPAGVPTTSGSFERWLPYRVHATRTPSRCVVSFQFGDHGLMYPHGRRSQMIAFLAERMVADRANPDCADPGWCTDAELCSAVWGDDVARNTLYVLLYRTRRDLQRAGFVGDVIQKDEGRMRLRVANVTVERLPEPSGAKR